MTTRTIDLGKIAYAGTRKTNRVEIFVAIKDGELSISGAIWNGRGSNYASGGQNLEEIAKLFPGNPLVESVVAVWARWHLNHMKAGTPRQDAFLDGLGRYQSYDWACESLKAAGLYEDDSYLHQGKPYRYGHAWLRRELPTEVLAEIETWFA